jgi:hypothetical protein
MILSIFNWLGNTSMGLAIQESNWGIAIGEMVHLVALAALGGTILLVDLRLFGVGLTRQSASHLARELSPIFWTSLAVMFVSGVLILSGETMKCYYNPAFRLKMLLLFFALLFHATLHRDVVASATGTISSFRSKSVAALSLVLWVSVGLAGRAIGYL